MTRSSSASTQKASTASLVASQVRSTSSSSWTRKPDQTIRFDLPTDSPAHLAYFANVVLDVDAIAAATGADMSSRAIRDSIGAYTTETVFNNMRQSKTSTSCVLPRTRSAPCAPIASAVTTVTTTVPSGLGYTRKRAGAWAYLRCAACCPPWTRRELPPSCTSKVHSRRWRCIPW